MKKRDSRRRARVLAQSAAAGGVFIGTLLIIPASSTSSGSTLAPGTPETLLPQASNIPEPAGGVTPQTAEAQAALNIAQVVQQASNAFGTDYAGVWIDNSGNSPVLRVLVTGAVSSEAEAQFRESIPESNLTDVSITGVSYSQSQLQSFQSRIATYMVKNFSTTNTAPSTPIYISVDPKDNAVSVSISQADSRFLTQIEALVPSNALRVRWTKGTVQDDGGTGWVSDYTRASFPPYKAGLAIAVGSNLEECTSGFLLKLQGGNYKGVTAGHCASGGSTEIYSISGKEIGAGWGAYSYGSGGDYYAFSITTNTLVGKLVAETNGSSSFIDSIIGRESNQDQALGLEVCLSGVASNAVNCGSLIEPSGTDKYYDGHLVGNLACATFTASPGDSGGAVYTPYPTDDATAAGVLDTSSYADACYTTIDSVLQGISNNWEGKPTYVVDASGGLS